VKDGSGQCFVIPWDTSKDQKIDLTKGADDYKNMEMFPFSGKFFTPIMENIKKTGMQKLKGWRFKNNNNSTGIDFTNDEIIRIRMINPYNILHGAGPMLPLMAALEQDISSSIYNTRLYENDARVSGVLATEQPLTEKQSDAYLRIWHRNFGGPGNTGRTAVLGGGLKYQQLGLSNADMQYQEQKAWNRDEFLTAFGLNKIAIGDYEAINYATIKEGRKLLWYDTYIPIDKLILSSFNAQWIRYLEMGRWKLSSRYDNLPSLQDDHNEKAKTVSVLVNAGFPPELASRIAGIELTNDDLKKWPHLSDVSPKNICKTLDSREKRRERSNQYIKSVLDPAEKDFTKKLNRYFFSQRNTILDNVDKFFNLTKSIKTPSPNPATIDIRVFMPDEIIELEKFLKIYKSGTEIQLKMEEKQLEKELGTLITWNVNENMIDSYVQMRTQELNKINTRTFRVASDVVKKSLQKAYDEGLTVDELAKEIKTGVHDVYQVRTGQPVKERGKFDLGGMSSSKTIARTEMGIVASIARNDAFITEGIEKWQWVTSDDDLVRPDHAEIDGHIVNVGSAFPVVNLRFPRDPNGTPEQIINCRCVAVATEDEDNEEE